MHGSMRTPFRLGDCIVKPDERLLVAEQGTLTLSRQAASLLVMLAKPADKTLGAPEASRALACTAGELHNVVAELRNALAAMPAARAAIELTDSNNVVLRPLSAAARRPEELLFVRRTESPGLSERALRSPLPRAMLAAVLLVTCLLQLRLTYLGAAAAELTVAELLITLLLGVLLATGVLVALAGAWRLCCHVAGRRGLTLRSAYSGRPSPG